MPYETQREEWWEPFLRDNQKFGEIVAWELSDEEVARLVSLR